MNCIILRDPVKFRSVFMKIDAKNNKTDEKIGHLLHFSGKSLACFLQKFGIGAVQKFVCLVDPEKC